MWENDYNVKIDLFEGPLDLLLFLVNRAEVDIVDVSVSEITGQYIDYLNFMEHLNVNVASDYLSMAATLIRLKAREILPPEGDEDLSDVEEIFTRAQLIEKLLEYKKYKEVADALQNYESHTYGSYSRGVSETIDAYEDTGGVDLENLSTYDLVSAFNRILKRMEKREKELIEAGGREHVVKLDKVHIDDRIERVLTLLEDNDELPFEELFADAPRRMVIVVTFIAVLELTKMGQILFRQDTVESDLFVYKNKNDTTKENLSHERDQQKQ